MYMKGECKEDEARVYTFSTVYTDRRKGTKDAKGDSIREHFFYYYEGGLGLEQVAQKGCGSSMLGDIQKPHRRGPA